MISCFSTKKCDTCPVAVQDLLRQARGAARVLRTTEAARRDDALRRIATELDARRAEILEANAKDVAEADHLSSALQDRLRLTEDRVDSMIRAVRDVAEQPDPLGARRAIGTGPSGIEVTRRRVPLGVIAIVYEARPNVTAECAALTIKSGNGVVLRGGKEALRSNRAIASAVTDGLAQVDLPPAAVTLVTAPERSAVVELLGAVGLVDLVIPRGGAGLMALVDEHAKVPVIRHGQGICHVYVDAAADVDMAVRIAENAKVQRPGVCNAMETLLIHAEKVVPVLTALGPRLREAGVALRADGRARAALDAASVPTTAAQAADWDTEFHDLVLAIRTVDGLAQTLDHIERHGTHHTAAIVTEDASTAEQFLGAVDASCVLWNASTRFNDGAQLGLGAEMGISTTKMHAYGPMSAIDLTSEKLVVYGKGQTRG